MAALCSVSCACFALPGKVVWVLENSMRAGNGALLYHKSLDLNPTCLIMRTGRHYITLSLRSLMKHSNDIEWKSYNTATCFMIGCFHKYPKSRKLPQRIKWAMKILGNEIRSGGVIVHTGARVQSQRTTTNRKPLDVPAWQQWKRWESGCWLWGSF